jgi:hypothetical protein
MNTFQSHNRSHLCTNWIVIIVTAWMVQAIADSAWAADSAAIERQFAQPGRQYSSAPLWVWNDQLTEEQIVGTLEDLAQQHVKQVFVHPRPGLMTPYLSADWFRLWKRALREAERLDMNVWIYDENSYPSGFAGGLVPEAMPDSRGQGLAFRELQQPPSADQAENLLAVFRLVGEQYTNVTAEFRAGGKLAAGTYLVAQRTWAPSGGWFGGKYYVDLLKPGVTEKFIEITLEAYRREVGEHFGKRLPGVFTDEPHLAPAGGWHWSENLPQLFQQRWGYDLIDSLPSLAKPVGDWQRVRHNYFQLLLEQFIERWAKPCFEYCSRHQLEFTGHYWEHGWPDAGHGGDNMAMYAWHHRPSIDILMNQYSENVNGQFGNVRAVLELASAANQLGCQRTLCEVYGAGGWDLRFEDMKRIGDWICVLGVNTLDEHLSYITIRGARKRDHPQSFSYHEPWWDAYHVIADYFTRLSLVLSSGEQVNRVLILEPTTTAWLYQGDQKQAGLGEQFQALVTELAKRQVEFDLGCEDIMARHGSVQSGRLVVGRRQYDTVVLPPLLENVNGKTAELLQEYLSQGGTMLSCGQPPRRIDGRKSDQAVAWSKAQGFKMIDAAQAVAELRARATDGFSITQEPGKEGILFHQRRHVDDGEFVFLANTSIDGPSCGELRSPARSAQQWDLQTGEIRAYPAASVDSQGVHCRYALPPCGSLLLFLSTRQLDPVPAGKTQEVAISPRGTMAVQRLEANVLTLDYVDVTVGGETRKNVYFYQACDFVYKKHSPDGKGQNPWDSCVQFRDELITKRFPADSGFQATYRFTIKDRVPPRLEIVIERPDLYSIKCNDKPVTAHKDAWWLDRCFGCIDLADVAQIGENAVTVVASPMTIEHELEPAYIRGDFALEPAAAGFVIAADRGLAVDPQAAGWNRQGHPFYSGSVAYEQAFEVTQKAGTYLVRLSDWHGSVARVRVNGELVGHLAYQPWQCDVTAAIRPGVNTIRVEVVGTLKNTLGPHHTEKPLRGAAWPHMFRIGPETGPPAGDRYDTIAYGLFAPFQLVVAETAR